MTFSENPEKYFPRDAFYYQDLNLSELKVMAEGWANKFSVIKQIILYRANEGKYVLDIRVDDSDKIKYRYFTEYWIDKNCYLNRLQDAYKTPNTNYYGEWSFLLPEVGDEPLSAEVNHVQTDSRLILFPRDDKSLIEKYKPFQISNEPDDIDQPYVFKKEGPTWRIHYEGAKLNGLRCNGFAIFYYLVINERKVFHTEELSQEIDNTPINKGIDTGSLELGDDQVDNNQHKKGKKTADVNAKIYGKSLEELKENRQYLQTELRKAKSDNDPGRIKRCEQELTEFNKYCASLINSQGQSRNEIDQTFRNKNRLCKRMERALNELNKHDEKTYLHFKNSLRPINSFLQSYNPDRPIDWLT
ncbi:MAG: hypothetical protein QME06_10550 [Desulfobacterales bacterium]|nr:hypothetical protein [Desulfobacterales bacterium]